MKLFGQHVKGPNVEVLVLPRQDYDIVLTTQAILDQTTFDELCPRPKPPKFMKAGTTEWTEDLTDVEWQKQIARHSQQRTAWIMIESLKATPKEILEWERVRSDDPESWLLWQDELKEAFFTNSEIISIMNAVWAANGLNQERLDEARNRFLAGQVRQPNKVLSLEVAPQNTQSGELVKDSTPALQG